LEPLAVKKKTLPRKRIKRKTAAPTPMARPLTSPQGLPPIDAHPWWRSPSQAGRYLNVSLPTIYRMLKTGELESETLGGRRHVTATTIQYHMLPPSERPPLTNKKPSVPFKRLSEMPKRWKASHKRTSNKAGARVGAGR
jgi:excisionase family DNA binding protein